MIRIIKMSGKYYGVEIQDPYDQDEIEQIEIFVGEWTPCLLVESIEDAEEFGIDPHDVQMVERD